MSRAVSTALLLALGAPVMAEDERPHEWSTADKQALLDNCRRIPLPESRCACVLSSYQAHFSSYAEFLRNRSKSKDETMFLDQRRCEERNGK